ncbi:hypothetical protein H7F51_12890 [Novosphingobium flavum]|uniref:Flippase-like domain-containing protein n=1 Tax=Novosphingobium flavum TaxID=1778672 RepID=A0A7X1KMI8_9SPHN|nr:hypothetical protein [Novosphingobium flavum]MBC2666418.1 hypothetical protein [Novosphingobium flavum]
MHTAEATYQSTGDGLPPIQVADTPSVSARNGLFGLVGVILSVVVVFAAAFTYRDLRVDTVEAMIPRDVGFWLIFVIYYMHGPLFEWVIFRRLWHVPFVSGIMALLRKLVSNELVLGYLGEAQFYAWARARANLIAAPFGAIKDVAILSALTGNAATVIMLVLAWPLVASGSLGMPMRSVFLSLGVVLLISCAILLFRKKLFSLSRRELWFITGIHGLRIITFIAFSALMWHLVLPQVSVGLWMVLATLRMLVSRLPLLPNKDIVFAGIAVFLLGHDLEIAALMTLMAVVTLGGHVLAGVISGVAGLIETRRSA